MDANTLIKRVNTALKRVNGMDRVVYLRSQRNTTGDALIGREASSTVDTLLTPQPVYRQLGKRDLVYINRIGNQVVADDYKITLSPDSITLLQLRDPTAMFILRDPTSGAGGLGSNPDESLRVIYVDPESFQGATVLITVIARSVEHDG